MKTLREYIKIAEAAELLGVSQTTLRNWADQGKIAVHVNHVNGYRLFRTSDLDRFLKKIEKSAKRRKPR